MAIASGSVVGNLGAQVAALIARRILAGEPGPGATLPTEAELCHRYGVSRTTVRDALKRLHGKGLVAGTTRAGTSVLPTGRWNQFDADLLAWRLEAGLDSELLGELYQVRSCFEPEACRLAAEHATAEDNGRIRDAFDRMAACRLDTARVVEADLDFHMAVVDATHNRFFISVGAAVKTALRVSFRLLQDRPDLPEDELAMHGAIAAAVAGGRGGEAADLMQALIALSQEHLSARVAPAAAAT